MKTCCGETDAKLVVGRPVLFRGLGCELLSEVIPQAVLGSVLFRCKVWTEDFSLGVVNQAGDFFRRFCYVGGEVWMVHMQSCGTPINGAWRRTHDLSRID